MAADDSNSDCELIIDETIIEISGDEEEFDSSIFHPMSITSADIQAELFHEDDTNTTTCSICKESFRYTVALLCHMQMEHDFDVAAKTEEPALAIKSKKSATASTKSVKRKSITKVKPKTVTQSRNEQIVLQKNSNKSSSAFCDCCKKKFGTVKHSGLKFTCMFCSLKFCWESKYKKHLHKTHKLNAAVICRLCSFVFADMTELACHSKTCPNRSPVSVPFPEDSVSPPETSDNLNTIEEVAITT